MGICPFMSSYSKMASCQEARCARWDKERKVCIDVACVKSIDELWRAQDNLAREINLAVLRVPKNPDKH